MKFWLPWGIDALVAAVALYFFFAGLADRSVSAYNGGLWFVILVVPLGIVGGSLWLRTRGHRGIASLAVWLMAVPAILLVLFFGFLLIANPRWN